MSVGYGWLWFIPLGPTRTSLGLVCPAEYYKSAGKSPEELYANAVRSEARIARLTANGTRSGRVRTTTDWSFLADRTTGENWFLVGEAAGFADPILSAGMTLTHTGGRELAYTLLALLAGEHDPAWLKEHYNRLQRERVRQHIRFADYWYAANGQFTDLAEHCRAIARDAGLDLTAKQSWAWLARGGFAIDVAGQAGLGGYSLAAVKGITSRFTDEPAVWCLNDVNVLQIDLAGAARETVPVYANGRISAAAAYRRGEHRLVATGLYDVFVRMLDRPTDVGEVVRQLQGAFGAQMTAAHARVALQHAMQTLEVMVSEGWVRGTLDPARPRLTLSTPREGEYVHPNRDGPV
jgi:hypothetical protein